MTIKEVYTKYNIPHNLQKHHLTVAKLANLICSNWKEEELDKDQIIKLCLIHDLGNIVKFDFEKYPELLGEDINKIEFWKIVKREMIDKYGHEDDIVTSKILQELNIDNSLITKILNKSFGNSLYISECDDWTLKILAYADFRISPKGVDTLTNRLSEAMNRIPKYSERTDLLDAATIIEKQIQNKVNISLYHINSRFLEMFTNTDKLLEIEI